jgi:hypothetical protein
MGGSDGKFISASWDGDAGKMAISPVSPQSSGIPLWSLSTTFLAPRR